MVRPGPNRSLHAPPAKLDDDFTTWTAAHRRGTAATGTPSCCDRRMMRVSGMRRREKAEIAKRNTGGRGRGGAGGGGGPGQGGGRERGEREEERGRGGGGGGGGGGWAGRGAFTPFPRFPPPF